MDRLSSLLRIVVGFVMMAVGVLVFAVVCTVLLPWRGLRIRACNAFGKTVCRSMVWLSGCSLSIRGAEHLQSDRPAIYVSNHTSILDVFLASWLSPFGTVGIAKKEVVYYPFFGQLYLLSGHLRIDRRDRGRAIASMQALADLVGSRGLSIFLWPEGTRSRDGRLLPFKKGVVHLALQTGLPVVPMVVSGAHRAWEPKTMKIRPVPIEVEVLPPISTTDWSGEDMEAHLETLTEAFSKVLPENQKPARAAA